MATTLIRCGLVILIGIVCSTSIQAEFEWALRDGFPPPGILPREEAVELGRALFFDQRLSKNNNIACATCHRPELAYTDGLVKSSGSDGDRVSRNSMSLVNVAYNKTFGWADNTIHDLESQMHRPMFGNDPVEIGASTATLDRIIDDDNYRRLFANAFPDQHNPVNFNNIIAVIAAFEVTLISDSSPFDRWLLMDESPSTIAARGFHRFVSLGCSKCHAGLQLRIEGYFNTGVQSTDVGLMKVSGDEQDRGKFKVPSLRNISVTAPYMHNGELQTLEEVLDHYANGPNPELDLQGFELTRAEREELLAFLRLLTDTRFLELQQNSKPTN